MMRSFKRWSTTPQGLKLSLHVEIGTLVHSREYEASVVIPEPHILMANHPPFAYLERDLERRILDQIGKDLFKQ